MEPKKWDGKERRKPGGKLERLAEDAACRASRKVLGDFTDHDLSAKDGRAAQRADFRHLHEIRVGSKEFRATAKKAAVKTAIGGGVAGVCYAIWQAIAPHIKGGG